MTDELQRLFNSVREDQLKKEKRAKDDSIRILIEKSLGTTYIEDEDGFYVREKYGLVTTRLRDWGTFREAILKDTPDYANDLNAMHDVELEMDQALWNDYADWLWRLVDYGDIAYPNKLIVAMASAEQKAEAYLRTVGKWVEE